MGSLAKTRKLKPFDFKESRVSSSENLEKGDVRIGVVRFVSMDQEYVLKYVEVYGDKTT